MIIITLVQLFMPYWNFEYTSTTYTVKMWEVVAECSGEVSLFCLIISISFQKAYKTAFLVMFVATLILHISVPGEFLGCLVVVVSLAVVSGLGTKQFYQLRRT